MGQTANVPFIGPGSITDVVPLADDHPVYLVTLADGQQLVVKAEQRMNMSEADSRTSMVWGSKIMKNVTADTEVNFKPLEPIEFAQFQARLLAKFPLVHLAHERHDATLKAANVIWVKMPYAGALKNAELFKMGGASQETLLKAVEIIPMFLDSIAWKKLGTVAAVDIFIGNRDRFQWNGSVKNMGNILFLVSEARYPKVLGLDLFDANSRHANLLDPGGFKALATLANEALAHDFAQLAISSFAEKITSILSLRGITELTCPARPGQGALQRVVKQEELSGLFMIFKEDFAIGILEGAEEIRRYLIGKLNSSKARAPQPSAAQSTPPQPSPPHLSAAHGPAPSPSAPSIGMQTSPLLLSSHRLPATPPLPSHNTVPFGPPAPSAPQSGRFSAIPQGVLDRMAALHWISREEAKSSGSASS